MKKVIVGLFCFVALVSGQATVTITDTLKNPDGSGFNGSLTIMLKYAGPLSTSAYSLTAGLKRVQVANGSLSVTLTPNASISPAGTSYSVRYSPTGGALGWDEIWVVPASPSTTTVRAIRSTTTPIPTVILSPQQISTSGATSGQALIFNGSSIGWGSVAAGSVLWGNITGTVSSQSDLSPYIRGRISATSPISYDNSTGVISCPTCGTGLVTSVFGRTGDVTGAIADITGLQAALDLKAASAHAHAGSDITSGTVGVARLGSGTPSSSNYLRGDGAWSTLSGITLSMLDSSAKTGTGTKAVTATGVPSAGCLEADANGNATSTGSPCGTGGGGTTYSVMSATQSFTSASSVTITHNFNSKNHIIDCYDTNDVWFQYGSVTVGLASSTVYFNETPSGRCVAQGGTGYYTQSFTSQTSVSLTHNLGTKDIAVRCYGTDDVWFEYGSLTATSTTAATVGFSPAASGYCVVGAALASGGGGGGGSGTVTSVAVALPSEFSVSGSPVTGAGTITGSWASQTAGKVLAAPAVSTGTPSFRVLAQSDLPVMTGDSGAGGVKGAVPAPAAGDAAAGKYLKADGTWAVPPGGGGGGSYTAGDGIDSTSLSSSIIAVDATVPAIAVSGSQSLTLGTIASGSCAVQTITATGATAGDRVAPGWPATLPDGLMGIMHVTATNTLSVRLCKISTGSADVTGLTFTYQILRAR